ncbi:5'-methylthioadenosine/S-adenosylhomocysteine nucleosidase [Pusillimonas noertemannii]|uniref:5'-methylthioadenosine/S-adenosylhomocysteine nucleosidase n=1 Tax=Pusillimonas noertemannii TaxID=305977 RepID=UPI000319A795
MSPFVPLRRFVLPLYLLIAFCLAGMSALAQAESRVDETPRIAIVSAFEPELVILREVLQDASSQSINGVEFLTGTLQDKPVVVFLSGISMTNAAMNTQLVLDRFNVTHILFSGVAGGVNPQLNIGDVTVVRRWGQYLETVAAQEIEPGRYDAMGVGGTVDAPGFGMFFTRPVKVRTAEQPMPHEKFWFDVDPGLFAAAQDIQDVELTSCDAKGQCLSKRPSLVIGGNGVSGPVFVDNAALREHLHDAFQANVVDMESAACAMVAYSNGVPFIAFRSLSDLAGGGDGANEIHTFLNLAAENSTRVLMAFLKAWQ